jgi:hypothetical protein
MTIDELEETLPNGFHDADLRNVHIDYEARIATLGMTVDFSDHDKKIATPAREVDLIISGLQFLSIDLPDPRYPYEDRASSIGGFWHNEKVDALRKQELVAALPEGAFYNITFVDDWNSFIHVAGKHAELKFKEDR